MQRKFKGDFANIIMANRSNLDDNGISEFSI